MNLDKEIIRSIDNYLSKFIHFFVPGLMVLEIVFHKGFFSGGIDNFYSFFLLLVWSFVLSLPYYHLTGFMMLKYGPDLDSKDAEFTESDLALPITILIMLLSFIFYKLMIFYGWFTINNYWINPKYILWLISLFMAGIITYPISKFYYWIVSKLIK